MSGPAVKRKGLSKRRRFEIFKRDSFTCQYCGSHPPQIILHVDHIVAVANGGTNDDDNLITACQGCNAGKSDRLLSEAPPTLAVRAADIEEREAQIQAYNKIMADKRQRIEDEAWDVAAIFMDQFCGDDRGIRRDWLQSIKMFIDKLGAATVIDAMEIAVYRKASDERRCFLYFCGVCWRLIKGEKP